MKKLFYNTVADMLLAIISAYIGAILGITATSSNVNIIPKAYLLMMGGIVPVFVIVIIIRMKTAKLKD